jgi:hypothetical protein
MNPIVASMLAIAAPALTEEPETLTLGLRDVVLSEDEALEQAIRKNAPGANRHQRRAIKALAKKAKRKAATG